MYEMNYQLEKCLIALFQEVGNDSLCWNFQHALMSQRFFAEREREKLKKEIINEVLQQISLTTNAEEVISQIKDLQKGLDDLYKSAM